MAHRIVAPTLVRHSCRPQLDSTSRVRFRTPNSSAPHDRSLGAVRELRGAQLGGAALPRGEGDNLMIGLGIASSHAPAMFCPKEVWPRIYASIPEYTKQSQPHTAKLETEEVIDSYIARINAAIALLARAIEDYRPDAIICIGDDQEDMYDASNSPSIAVFIGKKIWGSAAPFYMEESAEKSRVHIPVHTELAKQLLTGLVKRGFDPAQSNEVRPQGKDAARGAS